MEHTIIERKKLITITRWVPCPCFIDYLCSETKFYTYVFYF